MVLPPKDYMTNEPVRTEDHLKAAFEAMRDTVISWLYAREQSTPDMTVLVEAGIIFKSDNSGIVSYAGGSSPTVTAPSSDPRIDLVHIGDDGVVGVTTGTEAASPVAPTYPDDKVPICEIYLRVGATSIKDTDDSTNGYISKDARPFLQNKAVGGGKTTRIEFTRTAAAGSGNQVVTGAGFAPKGVIVFASDGSRASWGMGDDSDLDACLNQKGATDFQIQTGTIIRIGSSAGNDMFGGLVSLDADGFTIGWTKYNSGVDITCEAIVWA
ncbi:MAG: hypothetical protein NOU37_09325 [Candidatus Brocadiales bacterium]|nr:hypothetical protein [Candidatus Bathyanammoxibius amoris]